MLPFTKRPGRAGDDQDVITKEDLVQSPSEGGEPVSRSVRPRLASVSEEELTTLMPRAQVSGSLPLPVPAPLPAAGRPATQPPPPVRSRPASVRPPPASLRPSSARALDEDDDDEDEGRTVVRGAPKVVKRSKVGAGAAASSPAAVIKATLEAARSTSRRDQLIPGPPADLLEDRADAGATGIAYGHTLQRRNSQPPPAVFDRVGVFEGPPSHRPPASAPHTFLNPPPSSAPGSSPYAPRSYPPPSNGSVSVPGVAMPASMPAHFMTPRYSDPPATSVTSSHAVAGRPALSWAVALLGCGLLVGVLAVAMMQGSESVADTTASFVDPSRAKAAQPTAAAGAVVAATPTQTAGQQPAASQPPAVQSAVAPPMTQQRVVLGAAPTNAEPVPTAVFGSSPASAQPGAAVPPAVAFAPVNVQPAAPPKTAAPVARPVPVWKAPAPAAAPAPPPPKAVAKAAAPAPADEDTAPKKTAKKGAAKGGGDAADDETKKALEALQKAQLESSSSFGEK